MNIEQSVRHEIVDLHRFFEGWFSGQLANQPSVLARLKTALADEFEIIHPGGQRTQRDALLQTIAEAHASQHGPYQIWIDQLQVRRLDDEIAFAVYEEWQKSAGVERGRLSTALFRRQQGAPRSVVWLHLHETWLPQK